MKEEQCLYLQSFPVSLAKKESLHSIKSLKTHNWTKTLWGSSSKSVNKPKKSEVKQSSVGGCEMFLEQELIFPCCFSP